MSHTASVSCVKFFPTSCGERLVSGGDDCLIAGWNWLDACNNVEGKSGKIWSLSHIHKVNCLEVVCDGITPEDLIVGDVKSVVTVYQSS